MKRSTITLTDDLAAGVQVFAERQEVEPTLTAVVQAALREYLSRRGAYHPQKTLRITPAPKGSGKRDISQRHDEHLARDE
jgi:Arc/MetJ family transcription regulator